MYSKILVPLDRSKESEMVLPIAQSVLAPGGQIVLLHVLPVVTTYSMGDLMGYEYRWEEAEKARALDYLQSVAGQLGAISKRCRCEVIVSPSVVEGITEVAQSEDADLIAMYTHDRKGLAKLIKGSVAQKVQRRAPVEVRIFRPQELVEATPEQAASENGRHVLRGLLKEVELFDDLTESEIDRILALARRAHIIEGQSLGKAGEVGDKIYIILEGEAQLSSKSEVGRITVRIAGTGESFPLAALVRSGNLITTAEALTDMEVLEIPRAELEWLCTRSPQIGMRIYRNIADLLAMRYERTLDHLAMTAARAVKDAQFLANI